MAHRITLIPGDGIGPELAEATRRVLEATGVGFEFNQAYPVIAWLCWLPNLMVAQLIIGRRSAGSPARSVPSHEEPVQAVEICGGSA